MGRVCYVPSWPDTVLVSECRFGISPVNYPDLSLRWVHSHFIGFVMSWLICLKCFPGLTKILKRPNADLIKTYHMYNFTSDKTLIVVSGTIHWDEYIFHWLYKQAVLWQIPRNVQSEWSQVRLHEQDSSTIRRLVDTWMSHVSRKLVFEGMRLGKSQNGLLSCTRYLDSWNYIYSNYV